MAKNRLLGWLGLIALLLFCSCSLTGTRRDVSEQLLARDYVSMSDQELQTYYYQLSDQIAKEQRAARTRGGTAAAQERRDSSVLTDTDQLRDRWNLVRTELRMRGVIE